MTTINDDFKNNQIQLSKQFSSLLTNLLHEEEKDLKRVLSKWMEVVNMDSDWIGTFAKTNWLEHFHTKIKSLAPDAFWKVYRRKPSSEEVFILMQMMAGDDEVTLEKSFRLHRHRGLVSTLSYNFGATVITSIQQWISHATLNQEALQRISHYAPIIEVGAGTAYWSAILQHNGVDITPYDINNTTDQNVFISTTYTNVTQASCTDIFHKQSQHYDEQAYQRSLLIIWPNNPDNVDNLQYAYESNFNDKVWDAECLKAYIHVGGETVIFVGEREENIQLMKHALKSNMRDSGMCATRQFQSILKQYFTLQEQINIPTWWNVDDLTIWKRH